MAHQRTVIRRKIRALLDRATGAAERVFATRTLPFRTLELPAISVYTMEETIDPESLDTAPRELTRNIEVVIEAWVAPGSAADDAMDEIAEQIENAMHADPYLGDEAADSWLDSTTLQVGVQGDREMGLATLEYQVIYRTLAPVTPTELDDFLSVEATHNLGNAVHPDEVAVDEFTMQETP